MMKKLSKIALLAAATAFLLGGVTACFTSVSDVEEEITPPGGDNNNDPNSPEQDDVSRETVEFDFTDTTQFASAEIAGDSISEPVSINYKDGSPTGLKLTKCSSSGKYNQITEVTNKDDTNSATGNKTQVLQLQGSVKATQNSIVFTVPAGKTTITVKYFQAKERYLDLLDEDNKVISDSSTAKTTGEYANVANEKSYTFTVSPTAETTYYLGSHSSGMYITYLKIAPTAQ